MRKTKALGPYEFLLVSPSFSYGRETNTIGF